MPARNNRGFLPTKELDLMAWSKRFLEHVEQMQATLQISADDLDALRAATTGYNEAATAAAKPETRTRIAVSTRNELRVAMCTIIRRIAKHISGVAGIDAGTLLELGLTPPAERRRVVLPPEKPPTVRVNVISGRLVEVFVNDIERITRSKAPDSAGATVFYQIGGISRPGDRWQFIGNITRTKMRFAVPDTGNADRVWFCAQWYSNRGEAGPMSDPACIDVVAGTGAPIALQIAA